MEAHQSRNDTTTNRLTHSDISSNFQTCSTSSDGASSPGLMNQDTEESHFTNCTPSHPRCIDGPAHFLQTESLENSKNVLEEARRGPGQIICRQDLSRPRSYLHYRSRLVEQLASVGTRGEGNRTDLQLCKDEGQRTSPEDTSLPTSGESHGRSIGTETTELASSDGEGSNKQHRQDLKSCENQTNSEASDLSQNHTIESSEGEDAENSNHDQLESKLFSHLSKSMKGQPALTSVQESSLSGLECDCNETHRLPFDDTPNEIQISSTAQVDANTKSKMYQNGKAKSTTDTSKSQHFALNFLEKKENLRGEHGDISYNSEPISPIGKIQLEYGNTEDSTPDSHKIEALSKNLLSMDPLQTRCCALFVFLLIALPLGIGLTVVCLNNEDEN